MPARRTIVSPQGSGLAIATNTPLPSGLPGNPYSQQLVGIQGVPPYTWSMLGQTGTNGFLLSGGGIINGTPATAETDTITVQLTDSRLGTVIKTFVLTVGVPLSISTASPLPAATQGQAYSTTLAATGGAGSYSWSLISQTGGNGWSLSVGGVLIGTPGSVETDSLVIQCTDAASTSVQKTFALQVQVAPLVITTASPLPSAVVGTAYNQTVTATGGVPPYTWSITADSPDTGNWLSINPGSGILSGTPGTAETESLTIKVVDSVATPSSKNFNLTVSSTVTTFDKYIATNGLDTNPGTLAQPWAITSLRTVSPNFAAINGTGVRIGLIAGTYDISGLMVSNSPDVGALQIPGGTASVINYLGSSDATGHYSPRVATIDMKGASGLFGGGTSTGPGTWDGPGMSHSGQYPTNYTTSNLTIDGIKFIGFSFRGLEIGAAYNTDGPSNISNVLITNCEFTGGGFQGSHPDNCGAVWVQGSGGSVGVRISNNYFHDTVGPAGATSADHLNAIIIWGVNQGPATTNFNTVIEYNTCINAGNIYGKEIKIEGTTVRYNYIDTSMYTINSAGIQDFTGYNTTGLTRKSFIYNNIVLLRGGTVGANAGIGGPTQGGGVTGTYTTPIDIYNNLIVCVSGSQGPVAFWVPDTGANGQGHLNFWNNIYVNNGITGSFNGYGNVRTNPLAMAKWAYNVMPASGMNYNCYSNDSSANTLIGTATTPSGFATLVSTNGGISGVEAHTETGVPTFTGTGSLSAQWQIASGIGKGTGSSDGTSGGTATDKGAWGNGATQIGASFGP